jgi:predicted CXXCH cytochrome family protein
VTRARRPLLVRIAFWALIGFLVAIPLGLAFVNYTTRPQFCNSCHIMEPYVKSWQESAHSKVTCVDCHYEPGLLETMEGKFKAINQVVKYVTNTEGTKPWAEVSDNSCMRDGCHSTRLLTGKVEYTIGRTSIPFDHTPHLLEMRRSKKLRCTSCHSQIVQGEHLTVTATTCLLCHFKGAEEDPKLSKCTTCHRPPDKPIDVGGFQFSHDEYLARGVDCLQCHAGVTQGTGEVPRRRCGSCHAVQEHIERAGETEFMHKKHVTEHKVDCLECHTEMTHHLRTKESASKSECDACHRGGHGPSEAFYRGEGGRGVPVTPNPMFLTRVGCDGCHAHFGSQNSKPIQDANEVACLACHGPAYEGVLGQWQGAYGPATDAVAAQVTAAKAVATADMKTALDDAAHNVALVQKDGSRGVHNPWFARKLLLSAWDTANAALAKAEPSRPKADFPLGPNFPTKLDCAEVCHAGIDRREIHLEGTRFEHSKHVGHGGNDCDSCHTVKPHGGKLVGKDDCLKCHHGEKAPKDRTCASCHTEIDAFLRGVGADGEQGTQMMAKVECRECHGTDPKGPARKVVQEQCNRCHGEKYAETVAEWAADVDGWFAEADAALAKARAKAAGGKLAGKAAEAEALVSRLRLVRPAHNVLLFEEMKEQFEELLK